MATQLPDTTAFPWNDAAFRADPYPWYARARAHGSVHRIADDSFVVLGHDDAMRYAKLPCMRIAEPDDGGEAHPWQAFAHTVLSKDPPEHTRMRRLTNRWFSPKLVAQWAEATRELAGQAFDAVAPGQVVDAHFDLGVAPTHAVMCRILDLPEGDVEGMFWALWDAMLINATAPVPGTREKSLAGLSFLFGETEREVTRKLDARKAGAAKQGLVDEFLDAYEQGDLTWREVLETTVLLYMSGGPNPAYLIGAGFRLFAARPDVMRAYREQPEIRDAVVNELARLNPVELIITRFPSEDVVIDGVTIPAGSTVKFPIGAANRDAEVFDRPDDFDYARPPEASRNLTFGLGTHACAGQVLGRAETKVILELLVERHDAVEIAGDVVEVRTDRLVAFEKLPVVLR